MRAGDNASGPYAWQRISPANSQTGQIVQIVQWDWGPPLAPASPVEKNSKSCREHVPIQEQQTGAQYATLRALTKVQAKHIGTITFPLFAKALLVSKDSAHCGDSLHIPSWRNTLLGASQHSLGTTNMYGKYRSFTKILTNTGNRKL
jgi:hypothetical protein